MEKTRRMSYEKPTVEVMTIAYNTVLCASKAQRSLGGFRKAYFFEDSPTEYQLWD